MDGMILRTRFRTGGRSHGKQAGKLEKSTGGLQDSTNFIDEACLEML